MVGYLQVAAASPSSQAVVASLPDVPATYVLCTEDTILPPPRQRVMAARLGVEPIEIASDLRSSPSGRTSSRGSILAG